MAKPIKLKFESVHEGYPDIIVPAKKNIPKWFKDQKDIDIHNKTFKSCVPFVESMVTGYNVVLPVDLLVEQKDGYPHLNWNQSSESVRLVGSRLNESIDNIPTPHGYHKNSFFWHFPASFEIPVGYSMLVTHPLNRFDLPFQALSVVIDGGYTLSPFAFVTFFIREGFEGIIPQGTPIVHIFPFKNDKWTAEKTPGTVKKGELMAKKSTAVYSGWYKKTWWTKKHYD